MIKFIQLLTVFSLLFLFGCPKNGGLSSGMEGDPNMDADKVRKTNNNLKKGRFSDAVNGLTDPPCVNCAKRRKADSSAVKKYSRSSQVKKMLQALRTNLRKNCPGAGNVRCSGKRKAGSLRKCYKNVKVALYAGGFTRRYLPGAFAYQAHSKGTLKGIGFKNIIGSKYRTAQSAPPGAILVYKKTNARNGVPGHIEVKTDRGTYISDFEAGTPISSRISTRKLVGIYIKPM